MGNGFGRSFYFNYFRGLFQIGMIGGRLRGSTEVAAITPGSNKAQLILSDRRDRGFACSGKTITLVCYRDYSK